MGLANFSCSKDPPKMVIPSLEDFLKEGCVAELQSMIDSKKHDCAVLFKRMTTTPDKAIAKAKAKAKSARSSKKTTGKTQPGVNTDEVRKAALKESRDAKQKMAEMSQDLVRELVETIEKKRMLKAAVSTGADRPATTAQFSTGLVGKFPPNSFTNC